MRRLTSAKACGGHDLRKVGESVTEVLEYIPGRFEVVRPDCSCRKCEAMVQAPMRDLPIPGGMAGPGVLAHIAIAKFCDHLPLYRQAEIYARSGLDIDRGQLAEWLGHLAWLLRPLAELTAEHVMAGRVIHADDTPVPVLAPRAATTKKAGGSGSICATSARMPAARRRSCSIARVARSSCAPGLSPLVHNCACRLSDHGKRTGQ